MTNVEWIPASARMTEEAELTKTNYTLTRPLYPKGHRGPHGREALKGGKKDYFLCFLYHLILMKSRV